MAMTEEELTTLSSIAAAVRRIETKVDAHDMQLKELQQTADRAVGAISLAKWAFGFLGAAGVGAVLYFLSHPMPQ